MDDQQKEEMSRERGPAMSGAEAIPGLLTNVTVEYLQDRVASHSAPLISIRLTELKALLNAHTALTEVLTFATSERDKISRTYIEQPASAYAGYANAMDDVIRTVEAALGAP